MPPLILLASFIFLPLVLFILLRVKPLYLFVSIVSGYFGMTYLGDSAELVLRSVVQLNHIDSAVRIGILVFPLMLTLLLMRKTLSAASLPFQLVLLLANSLLLTTFLVPLLPPGVQGALYSTHAGSSLRQAHDVLITGVAAVHVIVMWVMRPRHHDEPHHKKHH